MWIFLKSSLTKDSAEQVLLKIASRNTVQKAIDRLPEKYKTVLILYYVDELLYKEIAQVLDIPIGTVMSRLTRAREGLKTIMLKQALTRENNIININFNESESRQTR
jgi:RNA polymerase sigma-70 factor (ECF subfamily)